MTEEKSNSPLINAAVEITKAVPIYQDALQPFAKETGKALGTVGQTINAAFAPLRGIVWGLERIEEFVKEKVSKKLENTSPEEIVTPPIEIAGPTLESLRYTGNNEELSNLYANLLASSMVASKTQKTHPAFVEIIRNLCSDEAKIFKIIYEEIQVPAIDIASQEINSSGYHLASQMISPVFYLAKCENFVNCQSYITNLERLGLIIIDKTRRLDGKFYSEIIEDSDIKKAIQEIEENKRIPRIIKYIFELTPLGAKFGQCCIE
ncbi:DUF4393 domain-containing protein [Pseudomonas aeruginosa]